MNERNDSIESIESAVKQSALEKLTEQLLATPDGRIKLAVSLERPLQHQLGTRLFYRYVPQLAGEGKTFQASFRASSLLDLEKNALGLGSTLSTEINTWLLSQASDGDTLDQPLGEALRQTVNSIVPGAVFVNIHLWSALLQQNADPDRLGVRASFHGKAVVVSRALAPDEVIVADVIPEGPVDFHVSVLPSEDEFIVYVTIPAWDGESPPVTRHKVG